MTFGGFACTLHIHWVEAIYFRAHNLCDCMQLLQLNEIQKPTISVDIHWAYLASLDALRWFHLASGIALGITLCKSHESKAWIEFKKIRFLHTGVGFLERKFRSIYVHCSVHFCLDLNCQVLIMARVTHISTNGQMSLAFHHNSPVKWMVCPRIFN